LFSGLLPIIFFFVVLFRETPPEPLVISKEFDVFQQNWPEFDAGIFQHETATIVIMVGFTHSFSSSQPFFHVCLCL